MADHRIYCYVFVFEVKSIPVLLKRATPRPMEQISASLERPCSLSIVLNRLNFERAKYKINYANTKARKYLTKSLLSISIKNKQRFLTKLQMSM